MVHIGNDWDELLKDEWEKPYYKELRSFLLEEYRNETVYPPANDIYNALRMTAYEDVKVVILGQDPYHEPGQAHGLAFSVPYGKELPPSLVNILKELQSDMGSDAVIEDEYRDGVLMPWAREGVLLLNTVLTVRAHRAGSHRGHGWEQFTDRVIELLAEREKPMAFVLWGANAISKKDLILEASARSRATDNAADVAARDGVANNAADVATRDGVANNAADVAARDGSGSGPGPESQAAPAQRHLIITAPHPSPLSAYRGFFGGRYFSRCNYFLTDCGMEPVDWTLKI